MEEKKKVVGTTYLFTNLILKGNKNGNSFYKNEHIIIIYSIRRKHRNEQSE